MTKGFSIKIFTLAAPLLFLFISSCSSKQIDEMNASAPNTVSGTAIEHVTIIDAENGLLKDMTVIFDGDRILQVLPADEAPKATVSIDGKGKYLIPGLWDMHVHLTYDDRFTDIMPATFLSYGITSVRDTGGLLKNILPVVARMRAPGAVAPRVFFSGPLLDGEHVVYDGNSRPEIGIRNEDVERAMQNVKALKASGADFIKIYELVSPAVFAALVEQANALNMPIASHVPLAMTASTAGPFVNSMEHLRNVELDCAENYETLHQTRVKTLQEYVPGSGHDLRSSLHSLQRIPAVEALDETRCTEVLKSLKSTIQVPTLRLNALALIPAFEREDWNEALQDMLPAVQSDWLTPPSWFEADITKRETRFQKYSIEMVGRMHAQGVPIGAGTDTPIGMAIPGYSLHNELEFLVRAGLSPLEALRSATVRPAEFLNMETQMGTIEVGKVADLVLLTANPLENISNTRKISLVISKGVPVEN
jgi:hypothetical protein